MNPYPHIDILKLSDSSLNLFRSCQRKFEFRKMLQSDRYEFSYAAGTGTAMHAALQHYVVHKDKEQAVFVLLMNYPYGFSTGRADQRSWQSCVGSLYIAMKFFDDEIPQWEIAYVKKGDKEVPAIEVPFSLDMKNVPFYENGDTIDIHYIGFIDFILYNRQDDVYAVVDYKSTTTTADPFIQYIFADQCLPYGLVLETLLGQDYRKGFEVIYWNGFIHPLESTNVLVPFIKTDIDVQEWLVAFLQDIQLMKNAHAMNFFRRNPKSCISYGRTCHYFDLCQNRNIKEILMYLSLDSDADTSRKHSPRPEPWIHINLEYNL